MTHHSRIYDYIINSTVFDNCDYQSRLEKVIAEICKGHGEDKGYIIDMEKECKLRKRKLQYTVPSYATETGGYHGF